VYDLQEESVTHPDPATHVPSPRTPGQIELTEANQPLSPTSPSSPVANLMVRFPPEPGSAAYIFGQRQLEPSSDLRTVSLLLLETINHLLGEKELRALAPVAWRMLLAREQHIQHAAAQVLMVCAERTPQQVKNAICLDLYRY